MIFAYQCLLESSPRSDPNCSVPNRSALLVLLAASLSQRRIFRVSYKSDFDKAITHLTEAVLIRVPLTQHRDIVNAFYHLANLLFSRYEIFKQPDDVKSSIKYFRFLRINFCSLEAFDTGPKQTSGNLPTQLFHALSYNLKVTPCDMVQDLEEMVALIPEFITADVLTSREKFSIKALGDGIAQHEPFCPEDTQQLSDRAIRLLREATVLNPDVYISYALARCLDARLETTLVIDDCEEAIAHADRIVGTHAPGNTLTMMQRNAMMLISGLLVSRLSSFSRSEYLEDAIHRIRAFLPRLPDEDRTELTDVLTALTHQRLEFFGVTGDLGGIPPNTNLSGTVRVHHTRFFGQEGEAKSQYDEENLLNLKNVTTAIYNGEITDVEAAVEQSRQSLSLQQSRDQLLTSEYAMAFASVLFQAYDRTKRSGYLNEAITRYRDLHKIPASNMVRFHAGYQLIWALLARKWDRSRHDFEEFIQLCSELSNDDTGEVFTWFEILWVWATMARLNIHPSASIAYETAMSLLQETLAFCPTLQTQHLRLAQSFIEGTLPLDYASYQIENGQVKQAVETLERGRALIWSQMRGLRTSTDHLRVANPALAHKFAESNRELESVTTFVAQSDDNSDGVGRSEGRRKDLIGRLVLTQRRLMEERNTLISHIRVFPGFENFLKPLSFDALDSVTACGPVIIINVTRNVAVARASFPSFILILLRDLPPSVISTPSDFNDRSKQLKDQLLKVRTDKGLDSNDYDLTLASVLADLYELVGRPVIDRLRELKVQEKSRVWWCPTGAFCSLPLHAMGPIPSCDGNERYFSDLYISSYTPTLSALIESRKRGSLSDASDNSKPSILLVAQPNILPGAFDEIMVIQTSAKAPVTMLISAMATPETVIEGLREHRFAHFACHGLLEAGKPFDASLELHGDNLTLLNIVRSQLPTAEFAFLSACHTAELTEGSIADEGLHLAAAIQHCGFRSVVGTMWAMADIDGADLSKYFYKTLFSDKADQNGVPYHERSAWALHIAVQKLRRKRGMTLERWVNFVHYGV